MIPPQQAKIGLAGDPGLPKIAEIENQNLWAPSAALGISPAGSDARNRLNFETRTIIPAS